MKDDIQQELERRLKEFEVKNISGFLRLIVEASFNWGYEYGYKRGRIQASKELALLFNDEQFEV